jgi:hypothetical protein
MRGILMAAMLALGVASGAQTSLAADPAPKANTAKSKDQYLASVRERVSQIDRRLMEVSKRADADSKSVTSEVRAKRDKLQELVKDASRQASNAWAEAKTEIDRLITESEQALSRVTK